MKDIVIHKKGEYRNMAEKDSGQIGVLGSINDVNIAEIIIQKGKTLLMMPAVSGKSTEWAYLVEGQMKERNDRFVLNPGDSIYIDNLREAIHCIALETCRFLYLTHESVIHEMTETMKNLHEMVSDLEQKDKYTKDHSTRVLEWVPKMAKMLGLDDHQLKVLIDAALFHDLGKLEISDRILHKPSSLTNEEFNEIKEHPSFGRTIAENHHLYEVGEVIEQHHERMNGSGYPKGLKGSAIRIEARIIAVIDSFDAMTSDRPYRKGMSVDMAKEEILVNKGTYYDPKVVDAFIEILDYENKRDR